MTIDLRSLAAKLTPLDLVKVARDHYARNERLKKKYRNRLEAVATKAAQLFGVDPQQELREYVPVAYDTVKAGGLIFWGEIKVRHYQLQEYCDRLFVAVVLPPSPPIREGLPDKSSIPLPYADYPGQFKWIELSTPEQVVHLFGSDSHIRPATTEEVLQQLPKRAKQDPLTWKPDGDEVVSPYCAELQVHSVDLPTNYPHKQTFQYLSL